VRQGRLPVVFEQVVDETQLGEGRGHLGDRDTGEQRVVGLLLGREREV